MRNTIIQGCLAASVALLAGCGSSSSTSSSTNAGASAPATSAAYGAGAATAPTAGAVTVTTKSTALGTVLAAGPKKLTVYEFTGDKGSASSCSGGCATAWPPVTATGSPTAAGAAVAADLGTTTHADGTKQVTYKGHPLYYFAGDHSEADTYGQGVKSFGAAWYVLMPSGSGLETESSGGGHASY